MRWALVTKVFRSAVFGLQASKFVFYPAVKDPRSKDEGAQRLLSVTTLLLSVVSLAVGCSAKPDIKPVPPEVVEAKEANTTQKDLIPRVRFTDITSQAGIHFKHTNGAFGKEKLLPETFLCLYGDAFLDFDLKRLLEFHQFDSSKGDHHDIPHPAPRERPHGHIRDRRARGARDQAAALARHPVTARERRA